MQKSKEGYGLDMMMMLIEVRLLFFLDSKKSHSFGQQIGPCCYSTWTACYLSSRASRLERSLRHMNAGLLGMLK